MSTTNDASNVSFGKPKATGAVYIAPSGTTLPTDGTTALAATYKSMGYISEDGYVQSIETDTEEVKAWGGDTVLTAQSSYSETHTVNFIETKLDTLKAIYGASNVTEANNLITVHSTGKELDECVLVIEIALTGGRVRRIVVPRAKLVDRSGDITFADSDAIAYPAKFSASPNSNGDYHIEFISTVAITA